MIQKNPESRCYIDKVITLCEQMLQVLKSKKNFDCVLVMEDILEKLKLLNYDSDFCKKFEWKPLSKIYFATCDIENKAEQFFYFFELSYWIMGNYGKDKMGK
jgi:hypothetical protein